MLPVVNELLRGWGALSRLLLEECFKWAHQRMVFGKALIEQPVIRNKLAHMAAQVEAVQNWIENVTHQMNRMSHAEQAANLAGPIALLKLQSTRVSQFVMDEACQIFGGRAITRTGMGQVCFPLHAHPPGPRTARLCGLMVRRWRLIGYFPMLFNLPPLSPTHTFTTTGSHTLMSQHQLHRTVSDTNRYW